MHLTENLRKSSASKLLPFRSPSPALRGATGSAGLTPNQNSTKEQVPHEISMLRRPRPAESTPALHMQEQEGLAHDARNLLTSLELFSGLLAEPGVLSEQYKHFSDDLRSLTGPLSSMVEQLAAAPRPYSDPAPNSGTHRGYRSSLVPGNAGMPPDPTFSHEPLLARLKGGRTSQALPATGRPADHGLERDAGVMVKSCERLLAAMAGPGVALHISYEPGLGELALGGEALTRVLINLVKNASEAMPGGGRISITVRKAIGLTRAALLTVEDTGSGIPAHAMGQLFHAGFSSKKPRAAWPSAAHRGLGLTIVRDLVEDAGGSVRVASTLRKGSTFEIKLPCRRG